MKNNLPLVSVVIPTYCRSSFLRNALESVSKQTYPNIEVVVVDDNIDLEEKRKVDVVLAEFVGKVQGIANSHSKGGCGARNCGIEASIGEFVAFLDDDDIWMPNKIQKQIDFLRSNHHFSGVTCHFIEQDDVIGMERVQSDGFSQLKIEDALSGVCPSSTSLLMLRREILINAGLFDESMPSFQDFDMWLRCLPLGPFGCVAQPLVRFVQHDGDRTSVNITRRMAGLNAIEKKWSSAMLPYGGFEKFRQRMIEGVFFANGKACFGKHYFKTIYFFFRASWESKLGKRQVFWLLLALVGRPLGLIAYRQIENRRGRLYE